MAMSASTQSRLQEKYGIGPAEPDPRTVAEKIESLEKRVTQLEELVAFLYRSRMGSEPHYRHVNKYNQKK